MKSKSFIHPSIQHQYRISFGPPIINTTMTRKNNKKKGSSIIVMMVPIFVILYISQNSSILNTMKFGVVDESYLIKQNTPQEQQQDEEGPMEDVGGGIGGGDFLYYKYNNDDDNDDNKNLIGGDGDGDSDAYYFYREPLTNVTTNEEEQEDYNDTFKDKYNAIEVFNDDHDDNFDDDNDNHNYDDHYNDNNGNHDETNKKEQQETIEMIPIMTSDSPTNNDTTPLLSDIMNITHVPHEQKVIINFKEPSSEYTRQCYTPVVRARLSGPLLSIIQFQEQRNKFSFTNNNENSNNNNKTITKNNTNNATTTKEYTTSLIGKYQIPLPGLYYIEIIGILCNHHFDIPTHNFKKMCVINPIQHRLTALNASIMVHHHYRDNNGDDDNDYTIGNDDQPLIGYWKQKDQIVYSSSKNHHQQKIQKQQNQIKQSYSPLYTRYQPLDCRSDEDQITSRCNDASNLTRFDPYEFEFRPDVQELLKSSIQSYNRTSATTDSTTTTAATTDNQQFHNVTICIIGWSHTRHLIESIKNILSLTQYYNTYQNIEIQWIKARYPSDIQDINFFTSMHEKYKDYSHNRCSHLIVGLGQWPASKPMLLDEYEKEMGLAIDAMKKAEEMMGFKSFLRSIHYNPMGDVYSLCPPKDWRYPPVIDAYNKIIQRLSEIKNVPYIDTNDIVGPMWDSADDWCHLASKVGMAEALYILGSILLTDEKKAD